MNFRFALILGTIYQVYSQENVTSSNEKKSIVSLDSGDYLSHEQGKRDKFDVIPYQFWTKGEGRFQHPGYGLADGDDYVVFLNEDGKFLGQGGHYFLNYYYAGPEDEPTPSTKFKMKVDATGRVALTNYLGFSLLSSVRLLLIPGGLSVFHWTVATTDSENGFSLEGNKYLALKSPEGHWVNGKTFMLHSKYSSLSTKFHGWKNPEPWKIEKIDFDIGNGNKFSSTPKSIGIMTTSNPSPVTHMQTKSFSDTVAQTETWSNSVGVGISATTTFETGIPFVAEGKISLTLSASFEHTWGKEVYKEITYQNIIECLAPPYTEVQCDYLVTRSVLSVPYVMLLSRDKGRIQKRIVGIWKGVQTSNDHTEKKVVRTFPHLL